MRPPRIRVLVFVPLTAFLAACAAPGAQATPIDVVAIPTQSPRGVIDLGPQGCPAALLEGILVRHETAGLAVQGDPLFPPSVVVWPHGWVAADVDGERVVIDDAGRIVGREGDRFSAGGGSYPPNDWFHPCGEISLAPAS